MPVYSCNFCLRTEPDCGLCCGCDPSDHRNSYQRIDDHMLDVHGPEAMHNHVVENIPPDRNPAIRKAISDV